MREGHDSQNFPLPPRMTGATIFGILGFRDRYERSAYSTRRPCKAQAGQRRKGTSASTERGRRFSPFPPRSRLGCLDHIDNRPVPSVSMFYSSSKIAVLLGLRLKFSEFLAEAGIKAVTGAGRCFPSADISPQN